MSTARRLVYVVMNFPVGGVPYVDKIVKANPYLTTMFGKTVAENSFMSKPDLERLSIFFPAGPRYKMFPYEMPTDFMTRESEPSGPSYTERMQQNYLQKISPDTGKAFMVVARDNTTTSGSTYTERLRQNYIDKIRQESRKKTTARTIADPSKPQ